MAAITAEKAQAEYDFWLAESRKAFRHKHGDREREREHALSMLKYWEGKVNELDRGGLRVRRAVPLG